MGAMGPYALMGIFFAHRARHARRVGDGDDGGDDDGMGVAKDALAGEGEDTDRLCVGFIVDRNGPRVR